MTARNVRAASDRALDKLYARINYERDATLPPGGRGLKLDRMHQLLKRVDHPERKLRVVHVAGSKGKGSTSAMIAAMLTASGLRTGLYTSPHLDTIRERFVIDHQPCSEAALVDLIESIWPSVVAMDREAAEQADPSLSPTFFEITTAMAMLHFVGQQVDLAVLEVGLGGRLDSTNVCHPDVSVITSISFDHTYQLGNTLAAIAMEKAGIIKPGVPVVSGVVGQSAGEVVRRTAQERGCRLQELGRDFSVTYQCQQPEAHTIAWPTIDFRHGEASTLTGLTLRLLGQHQAANAALALATIAELNRLGWTISETAIRTGLAQAHVAARVEICGHAPLVIVDAAHNVASVEALVDTLVASFSPSRRLLVFSTTQDKDAQGMLERLLPRFERIILTRYQTNPRAIPPRELIELVPESAADVVQVVDDPREAWQAVCQDADRDDLVCVTGSFFIAAEMRRLIRTHPAQGRVV